MSDSPNKHAFLAIRGEFTIFSAHQIKAQLLEIITNTETTDIDIDLADVTDIDTAGLQLMLMVKQEASAAGRNVHFVRHSDEVLELINLCNLAGQFGDPLLIHSQA